LDNRKTKTIKESEAPVKPFPIVGIGASAGGLEAFKRLLNGIRENSGMAYVLVQHLSPTHESMLPEILKKVTPLPVVEITDKIQVEPDHIYIIPENQLLVADDNVLKLIPRPGAEQQNVNLPIDVFFTSLAQVYQSHAIGVILSGTAHDGTKGLKAIKDYGGLTFAQEPDSATYAGMPQSAIDAGVVDFILTPEKIPGKITELTSITNGVNIETGTVSKPEEEVFKQILALLRIRKGTDFTHYKQNTIRRRMLRRMALSKNDSPESYLLYLRENKAEQDVLYQDLLIPVTGFFRDPKTFDSLSEKVFPQILKKKEPGEPFRVWVAGCSTGEEVYSIAICIKDILGHRPNKVQIFATDISEPAIAKARAGIYTKSDIEGLSHQHLEEYFARTDGSYQVNKSVRDMCVFAVHNFLKDPPFGKMDLISCRNVLIYMEPYLQKKALTTFHYALNPKGYLLLGKSETTSSVGDYFTQVSNKDGKYDKLFTRNDIVGRYVPIMTRQKEENFATHPSFPKTLPILTDYKKAADEVLLNKYTTPGVVINEAMDIVHFRGKTGTYLEPSVGKPSLNILKMAKDELAFELRNLLHKAIKENETVTRPGIVLTDNGNRKTVTIEVIPLKEMAEIHYLVLFYDGSDKEVNSGAAAVADAHRRKIAERQTPDEKLQRIEQLEKELARAKEDMRSITEEQEAANEELQSANEELVSGSEELQSLNEELETGKEELQSANEELITINKELISSYEEVTEAREYADSIIATVSTPLLVLNKKLRIKSANRAFYKTFHVNETETEGKLVYEVGNKQWDIPELRSLLEKILPQKSSFQEYQVDVAFPVIGQRVMLLNAKEITRKSSNEKLILLSIHDITDSRLFEKEKLARKRFYSLLMQTPAAIAVFSGKERLFTMANRQFQELFARSEEQLIGKKFNQVFPDFEEPKMEKIFDEVWTQAVAHTEYEFAASYQKKDGQLRTGYYNFIIQPVLNLDDKVEDTMIHLYEVTELVLARKKVEETEHRYRDMMLSSPSMIAILTGENLVVEAANDSILDSWGKGRDVIGKPLAEVMPEIIQQGFGDILHQVYTTGKPYQAYETPVYQNRNGKKELGYFTFIYQPQRDLNGTISGVTIIANENTTQAEYHNKIRESEKKFRQLAELMPNKITTAEPDGKITFYSKSWEDFSGISVEILLKEGWHGLIHPDDVLAVKDRRKIALETGENFEMEFRMRGKDGKYYWHLCRVSALKDEFGKVTRWVGTMTDIERIREEEQRKGDFIKMVSHELKTPITSIKGYVQLLINMLRNEVTVPAAPITSSLGRIDKQLVRLTRLITEMLDLSRIEAGKLELQKEIFDINELVKETVEDVKQTSATHQIEIKNEIYCSVEGDRGRIEQVIINFLDNAIKYSPAASRIIVHIHQDGAYRVAVSVQDFGIGIAKEDQGKIFDRFYRTDGRSELSYVGFGIGLFIANEIIQRHDGFIEVKSDKGKGSTFTFFLPMKKINSK
jgi:two-component system CheB/CheR fusion protein